MAPIQNIVTDHTHNSPKKSKKKNKKNRSTSEKEAERKSSEKEMSVEKSVTNAPAEKVLPLESSTAQPSSTQPIPVQATAVQPSPVKAAPEQPFPVQAVPVQSSPEQIAPEISAPVQAVAAKRLAVQPSPPRDVIVLSQYNILKQAKNENNDNLKNESAVTKAVAAASLEETEDTSKGGVAQSSLAGEVAKARQLIKNSLQCMDSVAAMAGTPNVELMNKVSGLEKETKDLRAKVETLDKYLKQLTLQFETYVARNPPAQASAAAPSAAPKAAAPAAAKDDSDDGVDLFGSDDEEESAEAARLREERLAAYKAKASKKPVLIAKSNIILDVKPWDDETDMKAMEAEVRKVTCDGLLWGAAKLVPLAFGIHKLQISCVVEDDKVSVDWLTEELEKIEDFIQSVDIAAFNKV